MKKTIISLMALSSMLASAAVSIGFKTHQGASGGPDGLPIVDSNGAAILNSTNSIFASIGYLITGGDSSPMSVLSRFVPIDSTPLIPSLSSGTTPRNGLISGNDFNDTGSLLPANYISNFVGKQAVVIIGNSNVIANSTMMGMYTFGNFVAPDLGGNLSISMTVHRTTSQTNTTSTGSAQYFTTTPTIGLIRSVTTQPISGNTYANGLQLVAVPEASTSLLGVIGALALLRRRRN